jgi:Flp pilus assembly protein TadG
VSRLAFIVALGAMIFIGWLYIGEMSNVRSTKAEVTAAADSTAVALAQSPNPERNTDADADGIFRKNIQTPSALEDVTVKQNVQAISAERLRQSVKVSARARTALSEFFNMQGAEIEVTATHDFDRKR